MNASKRVEFADEDLCQLAALDPAREISTSAQQQQAVLVRVKSDQSPDTFGRRRSPLAHPLRWAGVAAVAATLAALFIIAPFGSQDSGSAFATWTPVPTKISPDMDHVLSSFCNTPRPHAEETGIADECEILAKEQRGKVGFVAARTPTGSLKTAVFVGEDEVLRSRSPAPTKAQEPADDEAKALIRAGSVPLPDSSREVTVETDRLVTTIIGLAGSEVAAVEIAVNPEVSDPADSQMFPVQATVENGVFAAWWPAKEEIAYTPENAVVLNVTLNSGEVINNVPIFEWYENG